MKKTSFSAGLTILMSALSFSFAFAAEMKENGEAIHPITPVVLEVFNIVKENSVNAERLDLIDKTALLADENQAIKHILETINDPRSEYSAGEIEIRNSQSSETNEFSIVVAQTFRKNNYTIGYVHFTKFSSDLGSTAEKIIKKMIYNIEIKGLIMDLRNNGGGFIFEARRISELFLKKNSVIAFLIDNKKRKEVMKVWAGDNPNFNKPLVVLVNEKSASSAEIVANALQFHKAAFIIGTPSYGKSSVQMNYLLKNSGRLKITTGEWKGPNGRTSRVMPNLIINNTNENEKDSQLEKAIEKTTELINKKMTEICE